jgi:hypothetical protein
VGVVVEVVAEDEEEGEGEDEEAVGEDEIDDTVTDDRKSLRLDLSQHFYVALVVGPYGTHVLIY